MLGFWLTKMRRLTGRRLACGVRQEWIAMGSNARVQGFTTLYADFGRHQRGIDGFDPKAAIDGLEHALSSITVEKAAYIWNQLLPPLYRTLHGRYQTATHQNFDNANTREGDSALCEMLKTHSWIPVQGDVFKKPDECTISDSASILMRNDGLVARLGVRPDPKEIQKESLKTQETLITQAGFAPEVAALLVQNRDALTAAIINQIIAANSGAGADKPEFPERPVHNRERRTTAVHARAGS